MEMDKESGNSMVDFVEALLRARDKEPEINNDNKKGEWTVFDKKGNSITLLA